MSNWSSAGLGPAPAFITEVAGLTAPEGKGRDKWLADLAHYQLVDDSLEFDLFQDVRALVLVHVPGAYGRVDTQVFARFYTGASVLLSREERVQVTEALANNACLWGEDGWSSLFPSSPALSQESIENLTGNGKGRQIDVLLLCKEDIAAVKAYRQAVNPRLPYMAIRSGELASSLWKFLDTGEFPRKDLDALARQRLAVRRAADLVGMFGDQSSRERLAEEQAKLAEMEA